MTTPHDERGAAHLVIFAAFMLVSAAP